MQCLGDAVLGNGSVPMRPHEQPSRFGIRRNGWKVHARAGHAVEQCAVDHIFDDVGLIRIGGQVSYASLRSFSSSNIVQ